jgi:hypothetical protein
VVGVGFRHPSLSSQALALTDKGILISLCHLITEVVLFCLLRQWKGPYWFHVLQEREEGGSGTSNSKLLRFSPRDFVNRK